MTINLTPAQRKSLLAELDGINSVLAQLTEAAPVKAKKAKTAVTTIICERCGDEVPKKAWNQKRCPECRVIVAAEKSGAFHAGIVEAKAAKAEVEAMAAALLPQPVEGNPLAALLKANDLPTGGKVWEAAKADLSTGFLDLKALAEIAEEEKAERAEKRAAKKAAKEAEKEAKAHKVLVAQQITAEMDGELDAEIKAVIKGIDGLTITPSQRVAIKELVDTGCWSLTDAMTMLAII